MNTYNNLDALETALRTAKKQLKALKETHNRAALTLPETRIQQQKEESQAEMLVTTLANQIALLSMGSHVAFDDGVIAPFEFVQAVYVITNGWSGHENLAEFQACVHRQLFDSFSVYLGKPEYHSIAMWADRILMGGYNPIWQRPWRGYGCNPLMMKALFMVLEIGLTCEKHNLLEWAMQWDTERANAILAWTRAAKAQEEGLTYAEQIEEMLDTLADAVDPKLSAHVQPDTPFPLKRVLREIKRLHRSQAPEGGKSGDAGAVKAEIRAGDTVQFARAGSFLTGKLGQVVAVNPEEETATVCFDEMLTMPVDIPDITLKYE